VHKLLHLDSVDAEAIRLSHAVAPGTSLLPVHFSLACFSGSVIGSCRVVLLVGAAVANETVPAVDCVFAACLACFTRALSHIYQQRISSCQPLPLPCTPLEVLRAEPSLGEALAPIVFFSCRNAALQMQ
jgi:hypothetical protein